MPVTYAADGAIGTITLDNPPANSYDIELMRELADAIGDGERGRRASASWCCAARASGSSARARTSSGSWRTTSTRTWT